MQLHAYKIYLILILIHDLFSTLASLKYEEESKNAVNKGLVQELKPFP